LVDRLPPDELLELFQVARQVFFRYQLDKMEISALLTAMSSIEKSMKDILSNPTARLKRWEQLRRQELIKEIDALTLGIREQVSGEISSLAGQAGAESAIYHSQTMSLGGKVQGFNNVALSPEQFQSFFQSTPLGGVTLTQWVDKAFDTTVRHGILEDLGAGVLQGKGYPGLVDNIMGHMQGFTRKEAVTLARTFVQQANVTAQQAVMSANSDIVKKWKWSSVLENGNLKTGRGTCIRCASLDGSTYKLGEGPPIPLHPNCRCVPVPITVSYRELGVDIDELEDVARPWTERPDIPIGEGGRNIDSWGTHQGEYDSWFESRGEKFQKNVVGPRRYEFIKSGKVKFKDLVDQNTGRLYRLDELKRHK
jgi:hypothetical protein